MCINSVAKTAINLLVVCTGKREVDTNLVNRKKEEEEEHISSDNSNGTSIELKKKQPKTDQEKSYHQTGEHGNVNDVYIKCTSVR